LIADLFLSPTSRRHPIDTVMPLNFGDGFIQKKRSAPTSQNQDEKWARFFDVKDPSPIDIIGFVVRFRCLNMAEIRFSPS